MGLTQSVNKDHEDVTMLGIYLRNLNVRPNYQFKYHTWYLLNITNNDIQGDILYNGFQSCEI